MHVFNSKAGLAPHAMLTVENGIMYSTAEFNMKQFKCKLSSKFIIIPY